MTDIVERLRSSVNNPHLYWQGEAADEIERNRAAIAELSDLLENWIEPRCGCIACDEARAAITKYTTTTKEGK